MSPERTHVSVVYLMPTLCLVDPRKTVPRASNPPQNLELLGGGDDPYLHGLIWWLPSMHVGGHLNVSRTVKELETCLI